MGLLSRLTGLMLPPAPPPLVVSGGRPRFSAGLQGGGQGRVFPYDAAALDSQEMGSDWLPTIRPGDAELDQYRDRMVARSRDMVRNDGWCSGAITRILDSTIGATYRLSATPDFRALRRSAKGFDHVWAAEYMEAVESLWRGFAEDPGHYNDLARQDTVTQQLRQMLYHTLVDGDSLALGHDRPDRIGRGAAQFSTCYQVVNPDRLSNPMQGYDTDTMRGGVELDADGGPWAYQVRKGEPGAWFETQESMIWERVLRHDEDGWNRAIHFYERTRAGQHRGVSVFAPVLGRLKMLSRYYGVELQAATVASVFGTYITSPYDPALVEEAMTPEASSLGAYQDMRTEFHEANRPQLNGAVMPTLAPGEKLETVKAERPNSNFSSFTHEMLRGVASCLNISYEEFTQDYTETNYSSARAAIAVTERAIKRRTGEFNGGVANKFYCNFLHECHDRGLVPLPSGAPDFVDGRTHYGRANWYGPGTGLVDGVKERQAQILGLDAGITTLDEVIASESGRDWREVAEQRAIEIAKLRELGLPLPSWAVVEAGPGKPATPSAPEAE